MWSWRKKATGEWYAEVYEDEIYDRIYYRIYDPAGKQRSHGYEYSSHYTINEVKETAKKEMQKIVAQDEVRKRGPKVEIVTL